MRPVIFRALPRSYLAFRERYGRNQSSVAQPRGVRRVSCCVCSVRRASSPFRRDVGSEVLLIGWAPDTETRSENEDGFPSAFERAARKRGFFIGGEYRRPVAGSAAGGSPAVHRDDHHTPS